MTQENKFNIFSRETRVAMRRKLIISQQKLAVSVFNAIWLLRSTVSTNIRTRHHLQCTAAATENNISDNNITISYQFIQVATTRSDRARIKRGENTTLLWQS